MKSSLNWKKRGNTLILSGYLNYSTLPFFWKRRNWLLENITIINVSQLSYIDSTGLAMFVRLKSEPCWLDNKLVFEGITENFQMLIGLYKLEKLIR